MLSTCEVTLSNWSWPAVIAEAGNYKVRIGSTSPIKRQVWFWKRPFLRLKIWCPPERRISIPVDEYLDICVVHPPMTIAFTAAHKTGDSQFNNHLPLVSCHTLSVFVVAGPFCYWSFNSLLSEERCLCCRKSVGTCSIDLCGHKSCFETPSSSICTSSLPI